MEGMTLDELAIKHNTDKSSLCHDYCPIYEALFDEIKDKVDDILEIGISEGASLRMWKEYFSEAWIHGIDIDKFDEEKYGELGHRILSYVADQGNESELLGVMKRINTQLDLIIDDGDHAPKNILTSLKILFPFLKRGAYYIIEDLEKPEILDEDLKEYNHWTAVSKSPIKNSNLIIIRKV